MDPITQGLFGAIAAQLPANKANIAKASLIGALAGMAPDLDVLIRSSTDSLLALEYHRHFTHSLLFVAIGGVLCGLFFYGVFGRWWQIRLHQSLLWSVLGFATHGLLDACTSYGTRLLWPLGDYRVAWDLVSVIDPHLSLVIGITTVTAALSRKKFFTVFSVVWIGMYLSLAAIQHHRALNWARELAVSRGHPIEQLHAKPSFGNIVVWKSIYESGDRFYVDAVKPGLFEHETWEGDSVAKLNTERDLPWLDPDSQQARDIERFRHFSAGFVALDPNNAYRIGDVRYSQLPHEIKPLWGIELSPRAGPQEHARYVTQRGDSREALPKLIDMILQ